MSQQKKSLSKVSLVTLCLVAALLLWLGFGRQGLVRLHRKEMEREACLDRIHELAEKNKALLDEIRRLRNDKAYLESIAREELNLIRENEIIYKFEKPRKTTDTIPDPGKTGENTGGKKGVYPDDGSK